MRMKTESPWHGLATPQLGALSARRADPDHPFDFYYAVNADSQLMLVIKLSTPVHWNPDLPRLKDLRVLWIDTTHELHVVLAKAQDVDLFDLLCKDLITFTSGAQSDADCIELLCTRLLKWQRLLSRGGPRLLDAHEIRGLFAELSFFQQELLPRFGPAAVQAWKGPSGFPQDFAVDNKVFEIKSHLVGSPQSVRISSPSQLWVDSTNLYLCVYHLAEGSTGEKCLGALVDELTTALGASASAADEFEEKLASLGYLDLPEYRSQIFTLVKLDTFTVANDFPRIIPSKLMPGIQEVTYSIQLAALSPFETTISWSVS
jgi:hypothetical protein